jgi:hypothetical protein
MKLQSTGRRGRAPMRIPQIPMEWMDPMSWRLPSGKALAEFWLQSGFLAPLMLGTPVTRRPRVPAVDPVIASVKVEEAPERSATFRHTRDLWETRDLREARDVRETR